MCHSDRLCSATWANDQISRAKGVRHTTLIISLCRVYMQVLMLWRFMSKPIGGLTGCWLAMCELTVLCYQLICKFPQISCFILQQVIIFCYFYRHFSASQYVTWESGWPWCSDGCQTSTRFWCASGSHCDFSKNATTVRRGDQKGK